MVGHTGDLEATIAACTAVDKCVKVLPAFLIDLWIPHLPGPDLRLLAMTEVRICCYRRSCLMRWRQWAGAGW